MDQSQRYISSKNDAKTKHNDNQAGSRNVWHSGTTNLQVQQRSTDNTAPRSQSRNH
ncbi:uncharacterized protein [Drosophila bipectinata]|uniref:uncharacterized protein isoform X4 n=1 Tax=Drosophila bipectinata TaxID=42026 RepID=UPI0038B3BF3A